ncbi:Transposon Ty3-G Gag-Pol poly [Paramuricea clavata]|uniref:Transposon Ty3-G Gag-Pol poly n=1 Tax=Paramuricea clavata TaxID=317549 RepID=A0A6S7LPU3_PARCT|nr:Transposon Ty3-G Gag-Pol poly [Paramuricea clavata]
MTEITFLGHLISADGIKPDPRKIEAILKMPTPTSKTELQRFLGMINYLGKFLPNLSKETAPLRQLLEKNVQWRFEQPHETAINTLKKMITSSPVLAYYEPKLPTRVTTDASKAGLGAVLEQNYDGEWKPVAFAIRAMTQCEQHYAQIEKETLAIVFACERFHEYTYGKRKYDLGVEFTPGSEIPVAGTLSRAYLNHQVKPEVPEQEIRCHVHSIVKSLPVSMSKLDELKRETAKDENLQKLKLFIREGWSNDKKTVPDAVKPYLTHLDEISEAEDIMLRGSRIIVPTSVRREMKSRIHEGYLGIERCKARAREALYWPGMSSEITEMISRCSTCLEFRRKHQREPIHGIPRVVISDNGPQYSSKEFQEFAKKWEFQHIKSSPYHPEANGKAERTVQTIKSLTKKTSRDEEDPYLALMNFRACPGPDGSPAPTTMLMNRKLRTRLPRLKQETLHLNKSVLEKQQKQKQYYDVKTKSLRPLAEGSTVRIQHGKSWNSMAQVMKKADTPRSYILQDETGRLLRRNRRDLLRTDESFIGKGPQDLGDNEMEVMEPATSDTQIHCYCPRTYNVFFHSFNVFFHSCCGPEVPV